MATEPQGVTTSASEGPPPRLDSNGPRDGSLPVECEVTEERLSDAITEVIEIDTGDTAGDPMATAVEAADVDHRVLPYSPLPDDAGQG